MRSTPPGRSSGPCGGSHGRRRTSQKWRQWLLKRPKVVAFLEEHEIDPEQIRPYNFRHTAISSFLDNGGDIYAAAQIFDTGVKQIERRYGHPNIERLGEQFLKFMPGQQKTVGA